MKNIKALSTSNINNSTFLRELTLYKKKFVNSILSLNFALLIQMPLAITLINILNGIQHELVELITISFLALIFLLFYFKIRLYINSSYRKILKGFETNEFE